MMQEMLMKPTIALLLALFIVACGKSSGESSGPTADRADRADRRQRTRSTEANGRNGPH